MSRVGKKIIPIPEKVKISLQGQELSVEGPLGKLTMPLPPHALVEFDAQKIQVKRENEQRSSRENHGLTRALIANMVKGVTEGFKRELEISGVGYRAELKGNVIHMSLGFSHPVTYTLPTGIKATVDKQVRIALIGADKQLLGLVVSEIRDLKPPEPYKGKGIKFSEEVIRRKAGKSATGAGAKGK